MGIHVHVMSARANGLKLSKHPKPCTVAKANMIRSWQFERKSKISNDLELILGRERHDLGVVKNGTLNWNCDSRVMGQSLQVQYSGQSANVIEMITVRSIVWWGSAQRGIFQSDRVDRWSAQNQRAARRALNGQQFRSRPVNVSKDWNVAPNSISEANVKLWNPSCCPFL